MRKFKILIVAMIVFILCGMFSVSTYANAEIDTTSEVESQSEEVIESDTNKPTMTYEELKALLESMLNEQQKNTANQLASIIAEKFNITYESVYFFIALGLALLVVVLWFFGSFIKNKITLRATRSAYNDKNNMLTKLIQTMDNISDKTMAELVEKSIKSLSTSLKAEIVEAITTALKIDSNTLSQLLGGNKIIEIQQSKIIEAFKSMSQDAGKTSIVNLLSEAPTVEATNALALENKKLKEALGEGKVQEALRT